LHPLDKIPTFEELEVHARHTQPFQEMAKNVQNSHFSFARIFIIAESTQLRSSPLHEAAERQTV